VHFVGLCEHFKKYIILQYWGYALLLVFYYFYFDYFVVFMFMIFMTAT